MKNNILKILAIATIMIFFGAGVSLADGWKGDHGKRGTAYGHYKKTEYRHYHHYAPPRPVYVEHNYRPVVVERHYYPAPVYYATPAPPSGYYFGMSVMEPGVGFSFGVSGR
jgi:hypothetical protein